MFILTEEKTMRAATEVTNVKIWRYNESISIRSSFGSDEVKIPSLCYITTDVKSVGEWLSNINVDGIKNIYEILGNNGSK